MAVGAGAVLLGSFRARPEVTVTSVRYTSVGRTAIVRLTNEGDSFVRCSRLVPTPVKSPGVRDD